VRFETDQRFRAAPLAVLTIYTGPSFYDDLPEFSRVGRPELLGHERTGDRVTMRVHYRFTADLPSAAHAVIDADKLTWVEETTYDLAALTSTSRLLPDHYPDRLTASARSRFTADPRAEGGSVRTINGDLKVRVPLVGGRVERAIVDGLQEHLRDESALINERLTS
jgi:hypothetical protein